MIELKLQPYCHYGCMNFEAKVEKDKYHSYADVDVTYISCANAKRCEYMVRYLAKYANKENEDDKD